MTLDYTEGDKCLADWATGREVQIEFNYLNDICGNLIATFSAPLALIPYLLRSFRIRKMFDSRDEYCKTDKIPRESIQRWSEDRVIKILISFLFMILLINWTFYELGY